MEFVLKILHRHLVNERAWLRTEGLGAIDVRYREGARMARERVPQLEQAIKTLGDIKLVSSNPGVGAQAPKPNPKPHSHQERGKGEASQLNLFESK